MIPDIPHTGALPAYWWNGFPIDAGSLCVDQVGAIDHYHNGYGYTLESRLATSAGPATSYHNGYGYVSGRVVI
jgi:hypothetical protein